MAECTFNIGVVSNLEGMVAQLQRAAEFFDAAPDDDPLKIEMAEFGEIDASRDMVLTSDFKGGNISVFFAWRSELRAIFDKLDARL